MRTIGNTDFLKRKVREICLLIKEVEWIYLTTVSILIGDEPQDQLREDILLRHQDLGDRGREERKHLLQYIKSEPEHAPESSALIGTIKAIEKLGSFCVAALDSADLYRLVSSDSPFTETVLDFSREVELIFSKVEEAILILDERSLKELLDSCAILSKKFDLVLYDILREQAHNPETFWVACISGFFKTTLDYIVDIISTIIPIYLRFNNITGG